MTLDTTLSSEAIRRATERLAGVGLDPHAARGDRVEPQPVHVVYGGADRFVADVAAKFGRIAGAALDAWAPDGRAIERIFGVVDGDRLRARVARKLRDEPIEDFRIDFEDGYGFRTDAEEDADAVRAARALAGALDDAPDGARLPRWVGLRIKPLTDEHRTRAIRTLDGFMTALLTASGGRLPTGFAVTLPKVSTPAQPDALATLLAALEDAHGLASGAIRVELLVETPEAVVGADGRSAIPSWLAPLGARARSIHLGAYDYQSLLGVTAPHQRLAHPACDQLRLTMLQAVGGSGIAVVDGATNRMPIAPHRGDALGDAERAANARAVEAAWREHADNVTHALDFGIAAGWDLHPAQLVARYVAVYADVLAHADAAGRRLRNFVAAATRATRVGTDFDDAASAQGLLNFFAHALDCGALTPDEATAATGLAPEVVRGRSFRAIADAG